MTLVYMVLKAVGIAVVSPRLEPMRERAGSQGYALRVPRESRLNDFYGFITEILRILHVIIPDS